MDLGAQSLHRRDPPLPRAWRRDHYCGSRRPPEISLPLIKRQRFSVTAASGIIHIKNRKTGIYQTFSENQPVRFFRQCYFKSEI